jgi:hypothetical protein
LRTIGQKQGLSGPRLGILRVAHSSKDRLGGVGDFLQGVRCDTHQGTEGPTLDLVCVAGWILCGVDLVGCVLWRLGSDCGSVADHGYNGVWKLCVRVDSDGWRDGGVSGAGIAF